MHYVRSTNTHTWHVHCRSEFFLSIQQFMSISMFLFFVIREIVCAVEMNLWIEIVCVGVEVKWAGSGERVSVNKICFVASFSGAYLLEKLWPNFVIFTILYTSFAKQTLFIFPLRATNQYNVLYNVWQIKPYHPFYHFIECTNKIDAT